MTQAVVVLCEQFDTIAGICNVLQNSSMLIDSLSLVRTSGVHEPPILMPLHGELFCPKEGMAQWWVFSLEKPTEQQQSHMVAKTWFDSVQIPRSCVPGRLHSAPPLRFSSSHLCFRHVHLLCILHLCSHHVPRYHFVTACAPAVRTQKHKNTKKFNHLWIPCPLPQWSTVEQIMKIECCQRLPCATGK